MHLINLNVFAVNKNNHQIKLQKGLVSMSMFIKLTQNSYVNMSYEEEKRLN